MSKSVEHSAQRAKQTLKIAIDGPAGAGKSTVAKLLAGKLDLLYIDTGAMYRAATWLALKNNVALSDGKTIANLLKDKSIKLTTKDSSSSDAGGRIRVFVDDEEITDKIRSAEISNNVSLVAAHKEIREVLVEQQRELAKIGDVVLDGRDIGTVVLPRANLKVFLTASSEERARRRVLELDSLGENVAFEDVLQSIQERDERDSTRETAPLVKAEDAVEINTDGLSINDVVEKLCHLVENITSREEILG